MTSKTFLQPKLLCCLFSWNNSQGLLSTGILHNVAGVTVYKFLLFTHRGCLKLFRNRRNSSARQSLCCAGAPGLCFAGVVERLDLLTRCPAQCLNCALSVRSPRPSPSYCCCLFCFLFFVCDLRRGLWVTLGVYLCSVLLAEPSFEKSLLCERLDSWDQTL